VFFDALAPVVLRAAAESSPMIVTLCACAASGQAIATMSAAADSFLFMMRLLKSPLPGRCNRYSRT
jgi:hypothetical protein